MAHEEKVYSIPKNGRWHIETNMITGVSKIVRIIAVTENTVFEEGVVYQFGDNRPVIYCGICPVTGLKKWSFFRTEEVQDSQ